MKKLKEIILTSLIVTAMTTSTYAGTNKINVTVDGQAVTFTDATPYVDANGRTMMPVAKIGELLNVSVDWNGSSQTVTLKGDGKEVLLKINDDNITVDGVTTKMDTKAVIKDGRTYVPLSAIAKAFGVTAGWDKATSTVSLKSSTDSKEVTTEVAETANNENTTFTAELTVDPETIIDTLGFQINANPSKGTYLIIAKGEYFDANNFTVAELKQIVDEALETSRTYGNSFETTDFFGTATTIPTGRNTISMTIPQKHRITGDYIAKAFGTTEDGEYTDVIDIEFTLEPRIAAEVIDISDNITFKVNSTQILDYYFVIGESEEFESDVTATELKEIVDNILQDNLNGKKVFNSDKFFGLHSGAYRSSTKTSFTIPVERRNGEKYTAKIFGVTENGEFSEVATVEFVLE